MEGSAHQAFRILSMVGIKQLGKDSISKTTSSMRWRFASQCAWQAGLSSRPANASKAADACSNLAAGNRAKSGHGI